MKKLFNRKKPSSPQVIGYSKKVCKKGQFWDVTHKPVGEDTEILLRIFDQDPELAKFSDD